MALYRGNVEDAEWSALQLGRLRRLLRASIWFETSLNSKAGGPCPL